MLAQVVDADAHDLAAVEGRASFFRHRRRVRSLAREFEDHSRVGQRAGHQAVVSVWMPGQAEVDAVKAVLASHEGAGAAFLGGAAEVDDPSRPARFAQVLGQRAGGLHAACAEQVMTAAVAARAFFDGRFFGTVGFLTQPGERVELAQKTDHGAGFAPFGLEGRLHAAEFARHGESAFLQKLRLKFGRLELHKSVLRKIPDFVADRLEFLFVRSDDVLHAFVHHP